MSDQTRELDAILFPNNAPLYPEDDDLPEIKNNLIKWKGRKLDIDKLEQELKDQELHLSEDQWMSVIVSIKRSLS